MSKFSVRKPFTVFVIVILIIILGCMSFSKMAADLLPSINLPYMIVSTTYIGATPEKVEQTITIPLEKSLATTSNVKNITSVSSENLSMLMIEFEDKTNMDSAVIELNNKIKQIEGRWSDNKIGTPTISKINPDMMPVLVAAIDVKDMDISTLSNFVNNEILPELEKTSGVARVLTSGIIEEKINITLNQDKIDELNNKILSNIDKKLAKTESDLRKAKNEIAKGKNELNTKSAEQKQQLMAGLAQIQGGKEEISNALVTLEQKEKQLTTIQKVLNVALDILNKGEKPEEAIEKVKEVYTDIDTDFNLKAQIEEKLSETKAGLNEIAKAKTELTTQKTSLETKQKELETAQITLATEVNKAYDKLASSEAQINKGLSELDGAREKAYKQASLDGIITQSMISNILTAENFSMPAGYIENEDNKLVVKVGEEFKSLDEIKNLKLMSLDIDGVDEILLKDVADIEIKDNANDIYAKINGNNGVLLSFQKQSTEATATVADNIKDKFSELQKTYDNVEFTPLMDQGMYIDMIISSVLENLLYGAILAVIVLLLFLRDAKPTIAIALSIPISLTFAITLMYFTGVSINMISLSGLALSVGMLVDNAIVVIENIYRLKHEGMSTKEAAIKGASSVSGAIFASTLTTISVFAPIVFVEGLTRQLFVDMALTIAYALLASLIVALTVIPALTSKLFDTAKEVKEKKNSKILNIYDKTIKLALKHKVVTLGSALVLFVGSIGLVATMGTAFIPEIEGTQMSLTVNFNQETSVEKGNEISNDIINRLLEIEDVQKVGALRAGSMMGGESNSISMYIILNENRRLSNNDLEKEILNKTSGLNCEIEVSTSNMDMSSLGGSGIEVVIKGNELDKLQDIARDVEKLFEGVEGISTVDNGISDTTQELKVTINKNKALEYGLTVAEIYSTVSEKLSTENEATTVTIDNKEYPVVVIKSENNVLTENKLDKLELTNKNDENDKIDISEISTIEKQDSMDSINRENSQRYITVTAQIAPDYNIGLVAKDFEKVLKDYEVPEGYTVETAGENESINQALADVLMMVALAIVFIYLIMVAQFQSLKLPFIIMFTIPLAFTGGLLALFITGKELSVISMLGFLILAGIIVNNGIVLIDYINQLRAIGKKKYEAIVEAGRTRLRPILMTALTTILGMSTMAFGLGMGADMIQALGIVVIGGMIYATILTLVVVPCMYDIFVKEKKK